MRSVGKWVPVTESADDEHATNRMLYKDRRGRDCVRYKRQWRLVERTKTAIGYRYVIGGTI